MKLLGWMHSKFQPNNSGPLTNFIIGQPSLDNKQYYPKPNYCTTSLSKTQRANHLRDSFASLEAARVEEEDLEEAEAAALSELFRGFLAIGTSRTSPVITDPSTPTFAISVEKIMEKETEVTEKKLELKSDELDKVLGAEGKDGCNDSSGRNSHVSTGRSRHGSTITNSGKPVEDTENNGNGTIIHPLQGYLLGSAIGTTVAKKEHRTSLGELFKTNMADENSGANYDIGEKQTEKESDKSDAHFMKNILKRRMLDTSFQSSTAASGGTIDSASAETKLHKIHMFHKKVHPESSTDTEKNEIKNSTYKGGCNDGDWMAPVEDITIFPQRVFSKTNPCQVALNGSNSNGNSEYWIKTDADYLVLEL